MSKNVKLNNINYNGVSTVEIPTTDGGTAEFKDVDEIITPNGSVTITENGTHDVSAYEQAVVNVSSDSGGTDNSASALMSVLDGSVVDFSIPAGVTVLRQNALSYALQLESVTFPDGFTTIGKQAFDYCTALKTVNFTDSITTIDENAFRWCNALTSVTLPSNLEALGNQVFYNCKNLAQLSNIPASVKTIGRYLLFSTKITTITFDGTPDSIDASAFDTTITTINCPWAEGAVANAPWGATNATINYNYTGA